MTIRLTILTWLKKHDWSLYTLALSWVAYCQKRAKGVKVIYRMLEIKIKRNTKRKKERRRKRQENGTSLVWQRYVQLGVKHIFLLIGVRKSSCPDNGALHKTKTTITGVELRFIRCKDTIMRGECQYSCRPHSPEKRKLVEQVRLRGFTCTL